MMLDYSQQHDGVALNITADEDQLDKLWTLRQLTEPSTKEAFDNHSWMNGWLLPMLTNHSTESALDNTTVGGQLDRSAQNTSAHRSLICSAVALDIAIADKHSNSVSVDIATADKMLVLAPGIDPADQD